MAGLAFCLAATEAPAQQFGGTISGLPASVASQATSNNVASTAIQLHFSQGLGLFIPFSTGLGPSTNAVYWIQLSPDNVLWSTTNDIPIAVFSNNNSNVCHYTNIPALTLANAGWARVRAVQWNGTNTFYPSNIVACVTDKNF